MALERGIREQFDWGLFVVVCVIATLGVVNLYSATSSLAGARGDLYVQQIYWLAVGAGVAVIVAAIDYKHYEKYAYFAYIASLFALVAVFVLGKSIRGTHRWIQIGSFQFQPSEFVKITAALAVAKRLSLETRIERWTLRDLLPAAGLIGVPLLLVLAQPDLGTGMIVALVSVTTLGLARIARRTFWTIVGSAAVALPLMWNFGLKAYQKERLTSFLDADKHKMDSAYQAVQSVIAIGSGSLFGQGFMKGTQNQRHFIPDPFTDFPLAVWAQEWGLVGVAGLLGCYLFLILWALNIASTAKDRFGSAIAVSCAALFFWHVIFNVGMVSQMLPVVGVTLPMFSYGGSSVLTMLIAVGMLMNVSMRRNTF
ncbi:MAG: rod shape-determining protein RodA [Deltaproteobacteria bacterium]|nr:rod shape-determining protein RodA [Deltaproteobacteria bacterium]